MTRTECDSVSGSSDLWGLTTYFNPSHSERNHALLETFAEKARRQGLKLLIVELAFGDDPHVLRPSCCDKLIQLRARDILWQKERLLNLGLRHLPLECRKVAWLDADVLFENPDWVSETATALDRYPVTQPFHVARMLRRDETAPVAELTYGPREGQWMYGMAYAMSRAADRATALESYLKHGHCGLAWAARKDVLDRHGFYDRRIDGGGDLTMAHAMFGNTENWRRTHWERDYLSSPLLEDVAQWGSALDTDVRRRIGYVPGRVFHLWHGDYRNRGYRERAQWLGKHAFDPAKDIAIDESGCWAWTSNKPELHRLLADLLTRQQEDA
jgi:hypothetical protein